MRRGDGDRERVLRTALDGIVEREEPGRSIHALRVAPPIRLERPPSIIEVDLDDGNTFHLVLKECGRRDRLPGALRPPRASSSTRIARSLCMSSCSQRRDSRRRGCMRACGRHHSGGIGSSSSVHLGPSCAGPSNRARGVGPQHGWPARTSRSAAPERSLLHCYAMTRRTTGVGYSGRGGPRDRPMVHAGPGLPGWPPTTTR